MDNIILGNRYELKEKIAEGGMSTIYKAYCHILNRVVCVKILKSEFSEDEEFLNKFNNEAKAAASLNHPNIISVYDVGRDDDIAYIVMEYVDGKNLKELIKNDGVYDEHTALTIARQICLALNEAHSNRIIHRDIKPHNIMINKNGIIKVGDFGIARAVSSTTITTAGNVMGSVHYFSPEQARGGFVDERSDIYSLGIVLYELLIGKPPYDAETPISVALKHIHEEVNIPDEYLDMISKPTQKLILKMTQKNISKRYKNVMAIIKDIDSILGNKDIENISFQQTKEEDKTSKTRVIPPINESDKVYPTKYEEEKPYKNDNIEEFYDSKKAIKKKNKTRKKILPPIVIFLTSILFLYIIISSLSSFGIFSTIFGEKVKVPNILNMKVEEAEELLKDDGLKIEISSKEKSEDIEEGRIISQYPQEKASISKGSEVTVVVSLGDDSVIVLEDYTGRDIEDIKSLIIDKDIKLEIEEEYSEKIEKGEIISQSPSYGNKLNKGDILKLYVSKGKEDVLVQVPNFVGKTLEYAQQNINNTGFKLGNITTKEDDSVEENTILEQNPVASTNVEQNTAINLVVSKKSTIITKKVAIVLPQGENVNVTVIEKVTGETIYNQNHTIVNGNENLSVELSGKSGESKQLDIYLNGEYYASTAPIAF